MIEAGQSVWIKDTAKRTSEAFVKATVKSFTQSPPSYSVVVGGSARSVRPVDCMAANPDGMTAHDNCFLLHISEATILDNLRQRYAAKQIYTYTGSILIAVNPFQVLPVYGHQRMGPYRGKTISVSEPHSYSMAEEAYRTYVKTKKSQSLIVSGESGSGKTETNKHLMHYIAWRTQSEQVVENLADNILHVNPLLEALGNAKTTRNNNSSRFGKFLKISMGPKGQVLGATTQQYLLERSRVNHQSKGERNYHIFYQTLAGHKSTGPFRLSKGPKEFWYTNQSGLYTANGIDDMEGFRSTLSAFETIGFNANAQYSIFQIIAGLLHLGNISFRGEDNAEVDAAACNKSVQAMTELLGVPDLDRCLVSRTMVLPEATGNERISVNLSPEQALLARDALAKNLYSKLFDWCISQINEKLRGQLQEDGPFIGLLDVYGFESFFENSFEQLCINFANEKLQQFFLRFIFKAEESLYYEECVQWTSIEYQDNQGCIDLIEKSPTGIMRLLDEVCKKPNGSDREFCEAVDHTHKRNDFFMEPRALGRREYTSKDAFVVRHFAGDVCYRGSGFLDKNNDTLHLDFTSRLSNSSLSIVAGLFEPRERTSGRGAKGSHFNSVSRRFINDLNGLLDDLNMTKAHFIRCIKPNNELAKNSFQPQLVLQQLRCSGTIEAVQLMAYAYPTRIPYPSIYDRYAKLMPDFVQKLEPPLFCEALALALDIPSSSFQLGRSRMFFKAGKGQVMEELADRDLEEVVPLLLAKIKQWEARKVASMMLQNYCRMFVWRVRYKNQANAIRAIQHRRRSAMIYIDYRKRHLVWLAKREREENERRAKEAEERRVAEEENKRRLEAAALDAKDSSTRKKAEKAAKEAAKAAAVAQADLDSANEAARAAPTEAQIHEQVAAEMARAADEASRAQGAMPPQKDDLVFTVVSVPPPSRASHRPSLAHPPHTRSPRFATRHTTLAPHPPHTLRTRPRARHPPLRLRLQVLERGPSGLGLDVDHYRKGATIGYISADGVAGKDGTIKVGDMIQGVNGVKCIAYDAVISAIRNAGKRVELSLRRKHVSMLLSSKMHMQVGADLVWEEFHFRYFFSPPPPHFSHMSHPTFPTSHLLIVLIRLYSNRELTFEKTQPPAYNSNIDVRLAHEVRLVDAPNGGGFLEIETASKTYALRSEDSAVLHAWRRELYELLPYLHVTEVKCGWLYKRGETANASFKRRFCMLFSSYRLLYFESEACTKRKGAVDLSVAESVVAKPSAKGYGFEISTPGRTWAFAAETEDEMCAWMSTLSMMLGDIQERKKRQEKQQGVVILKEGWADLKDETQEGDGAWEAHWFSLNSQGELRVFRDHEASEEEVVLTIVLNELERVERSKGIDFYDFCIDLIGMSKTARMRPIDRGDMQAWLGVLQTQLSAFTQRSSKQDAVVTTLHSEWLEKKSERVAGQEVWKNRWFVLKSRQEKIGDVLDVQYSLHYFRTQEAASDGSEGGVIDLGDVDEVRKGEKHHLSIVTEEHTWQLRAASEAAQDVWLRQLLSVCGEAAEVKPAKPPPPTGGSVSSIASAQLKMQVPGADGQACWKAATFSLHSDGILRWKSAEPWPWDEGFIEIRKALGVWLLGPPGWRRLDIILPEHRWTLAADDDEVLQKWVSMLEDVAPEKPVSEVCVCLGLTHTLPRTSLPRTPLRHAHPSPTHTPPPLTPLPHAHPSHAHPTLPHASPRFPTLPHASPHVTNPSSLHTHHLDASVVSPPPRRSATGGWRSAARGARGSCASSCCSRRTSSSTSSPTAHQSARGSSTSRRRPHASASPTQTTTTSSPSRCARRSARGSCARTTCTRCRSGWATSAPSSSAPAASSRSAAPTGDARRPTGAPAPPSSASRSSPRAACARTSRTPPGGSRSTRAAPRSRRAGSRSAASSTPRGSAATLCSPTRRPARTEPRRRPSSCGTLRTRTATTRGRTAARWSSTRARASSWLATNPHSSRATLSLRSTRGPGCSRSPRRLRRTSRGGSRRSASRRAPRRSCRARRGRRRRRRRPATRCPHLWRQGRSYR